MSTLNLALLELACKEYGEAYDCSYSKQAEIALLAQVRNAIRDHSERHGTICIAEVISFNRHASTCIMSYLLTGSNVIDTLQM